MPKKIKTVSESKVEMIELVLPNDTNTLGSLLGGRLMHWIDIAAALAAAKHCNNIAVTAEVDNLVFHTPIQLGDMVKLKASVNKTYRSSMEVGVRVEIEDIKSDKITHSNSAYLTFVNVDRKTRKPIPAPKIKPESEEEIRRYEQAGKRREQRLKRKHGIFK